MIFQSVILILSASMQLFTEPWRAGAGISHAGAPPVFVGQPPNIYIFETDEYGNQQTLTIPCPIDTPSCTISYTWIRENQELPGSIVNGEGSLIIPNITEGEYASREGVDYYCTASDNIGFDVAVRSRTITVYYAYFDGFQRMATSDNNTIEVPIPVALNSDVALECDVLDANPPPQIKWYDDQGEIQEDQRVRFLDNGHYLYLRRLQSAQLEREYFCVVANANLSWAISAPTRYMLIDNITQGVLVDYKQIGGLRAFVGNISVKFAFIGGVHGHHTNETLSTLTVNGRDVSMLGNIGIIDKISLPGIVHLEAAVLYDGSSRATRNGTLTIYQIPRITNTVQDKTHFAGEESLTYICQFEGFPLPNVAFYFNGAVIPPDRGVTITNNNLTIPSPQISHSGIYQCIISNEIGDDQAAWLLEVKEPIKPEVLPYNYTNLNAFDDRDLGALIVMNYGSTVRMSVDVVADPCPDVVWTFNGAALGPSNDTIMYNNPCKAVGGISHIWMYTLNVVLTSETSGQYSAIFTNIAGTTSLPEAYITVPVPISIIELSLNDTCLKEGSSVSIRCNIIGFPRPSIEFHKNNIEIMPEKGLFQNIVLEFYDQILIKNVTMNDEGLYSCTASDTMSVSSRPQVIKMLDFCTVPRITGVDVTSNPNVGEPFFIECAVEGIPVPNTAWVKDGAPLEEMLNDHNVRIVDIPSRKSSRIEVSEASINFNGDYQCIVSNDAGFVMHSFIIELMQEAGDNDVASLSLGLIVGISVGVTSLLLIALFIILVLVCVMCRICIHGKRSYKPKSANSYSANVAYLERLRKDIEQSEAIYPLYDTIPYSDPAQVWTKGGPTGKDAQDHEKAQTYKRAHVYEKIYEDVQQPSSSLQECKTVKHNPESVAENVSNDEIHILENDNEVNSTDIIESSYDEDNGMYDVVQGQKSPKIVHQESGLHSEPVKGTKPKHPHSDYESDAKGNCIGKGKSNTEIPPEVEKDNDEPIQIYASISAEHKAKKRKKMLEKQQKENEKEAKNQRKMEKIVESETELTEKEAKDKKMVKMEPGEAKKDQSKEDDCQCQSADGET